MKSHIYWCVIDYTLMVIDYQWLISKNKFPKVTILQVTCFWRFFQKSQLFKWLVLKKLPRVTNFDLSHQEIINMWPWHESSIIYLYNIISQHLSTIFHLFQHFQQNFLLIYLRLSKSFCSILFLWRKVLWLKTCAIHLFHSLLPLQKEWRTNRLNSFVSPFSLTKDSKD